MTLRLVCARNTLADANAARDWHMYADFAQSLITIARPLYVDEPFGVDLKDSVYAVDASTNKSKSQALALCTSRSQHRSDLRSNDRVEWLLRAKRLRRHAKKNSFQRSRNREVTCFSAQQFCIVCPDNYAAFQVPLASGVVF